MFSFISWQQYLLAVGIAGFFYYLFVILRFYRITLLEIRKNTASAASADSVMGPARPDLREAGTSAPELPLNPSGDQPLNLN